MKTVLAYGILMAAPIQGAVIFTDIDDLLLGNPSEYVYTNLDLNSDGQADLIFQTGRSDLVCFSTTTSRIAGIPTMPPNQNHYAGAFSAGELIGASFSTESLYQWNEGYSGMVSSRDAGALGLWVDKTAYLGVEFLIDGAVHYGWVEVFVFGDTTTGRVLSYAYESQAGVPISAGAVPEPGSAFLAAAAGIFFGLRRKRNNASLTFVSDPAGASARAGMMAKDLRFPAARASVL